MMAKVKNSKGIKYLCLIISSFQDIILFRYHSFVIVIKFLHQQIFF